MDEQSLSHTKWKCQYHIVIVPKYRREAIYGKLRQDIGVILRKLCEYNYYRDLLEIKFYDTQDKEYTLNSWKDCVRLNQYQVEQEKDGILIRMVIGKLDRQRVLPGAIRQAEFDRLLEKMESDRARRKMNAFYRLYDLAEASDEEQKNEWLAKYPYLSTGPIYVLQNGVTDREKDELEGYVTAAGYTMEDVAREMELVGVDHQMAEYPAFEIPLRLTLEDGDFAAEILADEIDYDAAEYHLNEVRLLPYFARTADPSGYIVYPDGAGALIDLDAPKIRVSSVISSRIYGNDPSVLNRPGDIACKVPVFGVGDDGKGVLGIVEEGESKGKITAEYLKTVNKASYAYATYIHQDFLSTDAGDVATALNLASYEKSGPVSRFRVRYVFSNEDTGYSGLAGLYREYLIETGALGGRELMPFAYQLETLGGLNIDSEILLLPVKKTVALTTLEQSGDLAEKLKDLGVGQVNLSLNGTLQGGLNHYYQKSLKLDGRIGGREEYQKLASDLKEAGGTLTMGLDTARVYRQKSFDGFSLNSQVSRTINNYVTQLLQINAATNDFDLGKAAYMVKPDLAAENTRRIVQALNQWTPEEKPVIRLGGFGEFLASDNRKEALGRQETQAIYESLLEELAQDNALAFEHGNAYVYPYASFLYNLDNANSGHKDFDAVIPFVQMALHGLVGYSGSPINLAVNEREAVLSCLEAGSMPYFVLAVDNLTAIKDSAFSNYTSVDAAYHLERSARIFQEIEAVIGDLAGCRMVSHRILDSGVRETVYDNGVKILVNYGDTAAQADGKTVEAGGYLRVESGG